MKYVNLGIILLVFSLFIIGCDNAQKSTQPVQTQAQPSTLETTGPERADTEVSDSSSSVPKTWRNIPLKDVRTGKTFTIDEFSDRPILLESFAVWCPTCTKQQKKIKGLHEEIGDSFVSISLDTDPNEEESQVKEHIERNGFDWLYAIAPVEVTKGLIDEFGVTIVNAPQAPVILICDGNSARLLKNGVKNEIKLKSDIEIGC